MVLHTLDFLIHTMRNDRLSPRQTQHTFAIGSHHNPSFSPNERHSEERAMTPCMNEFNGSLTGDTCRPAGSGGFVHAAGAALLRPLETVILWQERVRERRQLLQMSDRLLKDIGLTRVDAMIEADKPFWRR
jgi:uncharacterized protein YjiS (DUF1127 family)